MATEQMANMNFRNAASFLEIRQFWMISWSIQVIRNQRNTKDLIKNINYFVVITAPVDVLNKNVRISIKISVKFVPKGQTNKIPALVQLMARRWPGDKSLSKALPA